MIVKKLILFTIMFLATTLMMSFYVLADVETYYTFNLIDDYKYNLLTGLPEEDQGFTTTAKVQLRSTTLRITSDTFTYLYVYDEANNYLGFYGTQYTMPVVESLGTYLGNISTGAVYLPATASKMTIAIQTSNYNLILDQTITELNDLSLRNVFETNDMLDNILYDVEDMDGIYLADWYVNNYPTYDYLEILNEENVLWGIYLRTDIDIYDHNHFVNLVYNIITTPYYVNAWYITDRDTNDVLLTTIGDVGTVTTTYTTLMPFTFDTSTFWLRLEVGAYGNFSFNMYRHESVIVDVDQLGLSSLTQLQLESYLDDYVDGKPYDPEDVLSSASFDLINPYYLGEDIAEEDDFSPDTLIDKLLTKIGFNNDFAKTMIAVVFMLITLVLLAIRKVPIMIIISIGFIQYVTFTFMGWVEGWINIVLGIIIILIVLFRLRGGNNND